jgi:hypothetical protein
MPGFIAIERTRHFTPLEEPETVTTLCVAGSGPGQANLDPGLQKTAIEKSNRIQ